MIHVDVRGKALVVETAVSGKVWRGEGRARRPVWLQHSGAGEAGGRTGQRSHREYQ